MKALIKLVTLLALSIGMSVSALAVEPVYSDFFGKAIKGYDPVAYFTQGKPVKGDSDHTYEWSGAKWYFASKQNLEAFSADPERYAPQYGGYCAWAVSEGYTAKIDPDAWYIHDDKLYLNYSASIQSKWQRDVPGNIAKGDANWPGIVGE